MREEAATVTVVTLEAMTARKALVEATVAEAVKAEEMTNRRAVGAQCRRQPRQCSRWRPWLPSEK